MIKIIAVNNYLGMIINIIHNAFKVYFFMIKIKITVVPYYYPLITLPMVSFQVVARGLIFGMNIKVVQYHQDQFMIVGNNEYLPIALINISLNVVLAFNWLINITDAIADLVIINYYAFIMGFKCFEIMVVKIINNYANFYLIFFYHLLVISFCFDMFSYIVYVYYIYFCLFYYV